MQDKVTVLQNSIFKATEQMDQFKLLMNWNQEEIEQWALAQRQKEEDNAALEKYRNQDASKIKELEMGQEKVSKAIAVKKEELENEVMETQAAQIQLDKAAEDFRCGGCHVLEAGDGKLKRLVMLVTKDDYALRNTHASVKENQRVAVVKGGIVFFSILGDETDAGWKRGSWLLSRLTRVSSFSLPLGSCMASART